MNESKPTHRAHVVKKFTDRDGKDRSHWIDVGAVWLHKDGKGFDVILAAVPVDGRLVIRVDEPKPTTSAA